MSASVLTLDSTVGHLRHGVSCELQTYSALLQACKAGLHFIIANSISVFATLAPAGCALSIALVS